MTLSAKDLARCIDYTMIDAGATRGDIEDLCNFARQKSYHAVCVHGSRVELARSLVEDSEVQVVAMIGFPHGADDADAKRYAVEIAVDQGAHEIDFVINIGRLKEGDQRYVLREMRDLVEAADERIVKAVLETSLLTEEETKAACQMAVDSGVKFVVTGTQFESDEEAIAQVKLLRAIAGDIIGVKAGGNGYNSRFVQEFLDAGAARVGVVIGKDPII